MVAGLTAVALVASVELGLANMGAIKAPMSNAVAIKDVFIVFIPSPFLLALSAYKA